MRDMKFDYLMVLEHENGENYPLSFHTTRSKIDKMFFDIAFCLPASDLVRVTLYARHLSTPKSVDIVTPLELLNKAERKNVP